MHDSIKKVQISMTKTMTNDPGHKENIEEMTGSKLYLQYK